MYVFARRIVSAAREERGQRERTEVKKSKTESKRENERRGKKEGETQGVQDKKQHRAERGERGRGRDASREGGKDR